jgi:ABC-type amino acid transport system permease subunit
MLPGSRVAAEVSEDQLTRGDWLQLVWGFFWRGLVFTVASVLVSAVIGFLVGFLVGMVCSALGVPPETYLLPLKVFNGLLGFAVGVWLLMFYLRWLLRSRFGSLRLALVRSES